MGAGFHGLISGYAKAQVLNAGAFRAVPMRINGKQEAVDFRLSLVKRGMRASNVRVFS
jgi:hypothetical protein